MSLRHSHLYCSKSTCCSMSTCITICIWVGVQIISCLVTNNLFSFVSWINNLLILLCVASFFRPFRVAKIYWLPHNTLSVAEGPMVLSVSYIFSFSLIQHHPVLPNAHHLLFPKLLVFFQPSPQGVSLL